jgi:hypothetical protein
VFRKRYAYLRCEIVADALFVVEGAVLAPDLRRLLRETSIRFQVFLWNGQNISIDISHEHRPFLLSRHAFAWAVRPLASVLNETSLFLFSRLCPQSFFLRSQFGCELGAEVVLFEDLTNFHLGFSRHGVGAAFDPFDRLFL